MSPTPKPVMRMMVLGVCGIALLTNLASPAEEPEPPRGVADWPAELGNHRAVVHVPERADAVVAVVPWRRRDPSPDAKDVRVVDLTTGATVANVRRISVDPDRGIIALQPATAPGDYAIYYMRYTVSPEPWAYRVSYTPPEDAANAEWLARNGLRPEDLAGERWRSLPQVEVAAIQARRERDRFDPMEMPATAGEVDALLAARPDAAYLLFPEDRSRAIRMEDRIPLRWARNGPSSSFLGQASRGESYAFQIGVFAAREPVDAVQLRFHDLVASSGRIPAQAFSCINLEGTDWLGRPIHPRFRVPRGGVGALWVGVLVPRDARPGAYRGDVEVKIAGSPPGTIAVELAVGEGDLPDHGDSDPSKLSRLRWLNSTIGIDDDVTAPYTPVEVRGTEISCLGRSVRFGPSGLPESIRSGGREILAEPMALVVRGADGAVALSGAGARVVRSTTGWAVVEGSASGGAVSLTTAVKMDYDGYANYSVSLRARERMQVSDIRLEIPIRREIATYMMGLGRKGGLRPAEWRWKWDITRANNSLWVGDVSAGIHCKLKGPEDTWDLYTLAAPGLPDSWANRGRGGCDVVTRSDGATLVSAYTGPKELKAGEEIVFHFGLLVTPVKPLDSRHWTERYYHAYVPPEVAVANGANIVNIHHGNELNPNINYPFLAVEPLKAYVQSAHKLGVKVKVYYTVRELSTHLPELWALRSLGHEVLADGAGGGSAWLREHLISGYAAAWHHTFENGEVDAAIATTGLSRWHNYYLEGLAWLLRNVEVDGLYLDGIGYNREIMKRVRKVLDRNRPGSLIDFHSGNNFHPEYGLSNCANQYMEHFPYLDSLWFGEGFDYNESPDYWLVEISGIPFGLYGEMLEGNGNPWRGMIYGMTARYYSGADPKHIWALWDEFGIAKAEMLGYWDPTCPVRSGRPDVLATVYRRQGKSLVAIASWAAEPVRCRLDVDWKALGLDPAKARLRAPAVTGFQEARDFTPGDEIPIDPGHGWMLVIE